MMALREVVREVTDDRKRAMHDALRSGPSAGLLSTVQQSAVTIFGSLVLVAAVCCRRAMEINNQIFHHAQYTNSHNG